MLARDDAFLEIIEVIFRQFLCFQKMHAIVHFKSLLALC
jgi:hypothetical protein